MKAILEFNLPEDEEQYLTSLHGMEWALMVWELDSLCRDSIKHLNQYETPDEVFQGIRDYILEMMQDRGVKFPS
jgi:hypothetical protein